MLPKEDCFHLGVKALIANPQGKLLLLQTKHYWDIPGGRIHRNESLEEALKREIYEETGIKNLFHITPFLMFLSKIRIPTPKDNVGLILSIYHCEILENQPISLSQEHLHFGWFEPKEAARLLSDEGPAELIEKLENGVLR